MYCKKPLPNLNKLALPGSHDHTDTNDRQEDTSAETPFIEFFVLVNFVLSHPFDHFMCRSEGQWDPLESTCRHASLSIL